MWRGHARGIMPQCKLSTEARPMAMRAMSAESHMDVFYLSNDAFLTREGS